MDFGCNGSTGNERIQVSHVPVLLQTARRKGPTNAKWRLTTEDALSVELGAVVLVTMLVPGCRAYLQAS